MAKKLMKALIFDQIVNRLDAHWQCLQLCVQCSLGMRRLAAVRGSDCAHGALNSTGATGLVQATSLLVLARSSSSSWRRCVAARAQATLAQDQRRPALLWDMILVFLSSCPCPHVPFFNWLETPGQRMINNNMCGSASLGNRQQSPTINVAHRRHKRRQH